MEKIYLSLNRFYIKINFELGVKLQEFFVNFISEFSMYDILYDIVV